MQSHQHDKTHNLLKLMVRALFVTFGFVFILLYSMLHLQDSPALSLAKGAGTAFVLIAYYLVIDRSIYKKNQRFTWHKRGYDFASKTLHPPGAPDEYDPHLVAKLRSQQPWYKDVNFTVAHDMREFDRGVFDAIADYEREHGAP